VSGQALLALRRLRLRIRTRGVRSSLFFVALAVTSPLAANWLPIWTPTDVHLFVGQAATAQVHVVFSGLNPNVGPIHWTFSSDDDRVAIAHASVDDQETHNVPIVAVSPGAAARPA